LKIFTNKKGGVMKIIKAVIVLVAASNILSLNYGYCDSAFNYGQKARGYAEKGAGSAAQFGQGCCASSIILGPTSKETQTLRNFRDLYLVNNSAGRAFIRFYYKNNTVVKNFIIDKPMLQHSLKAALLPAVRCCEIIVKKRH
jgi:hypothetical protein